jgi:hypothetical protein
VEPIGIVFMLFLLAAALRGLRVAVTISFGYCEVTLWLRGLVALIIGCLLVWMFDSQSFAEMMRRSLRLLDVGLIIAVVDGIARASRWIDYHAEHPPPAPARPQRRQVRATFASHARASD